jgi:DNA polymerase-3 subunit delta'
VIPEAAMRPPWHAGPWSALSERLAAGALSHALLLAGPAGLGKRTFAAALQATLLCTERRTDGEACGRCRDCRLHAAGTHPDAVRVTLEPRDDGRLRSEILVEQARALSEYLAMTPMRGGHQVAIIDPADRLNPNAANALLKTMEEPAPGRFLLLVADQPSRLPATVRSRCMRFEFRIPPRAQALAWLTGQGVRGEIAGEALDAASGNPGRALSLVREGLMELRKAVANDLEALARGRAQPSELARAWADDRPEQRLVFAAERAAALARHALTDPGLFHKLEWWFGRANRVREWVPTTLRTDLVLAELLLEWPPAAA